jgi:hypothetical protein
MFFRLETGVLAGGKAKPFLASDVFAAIDQIAFPTRYQLIEDEDTLACWVETPSAPAHTRVRFGRTRRSAFPKRELMGTVSDLEVEPDEGLVETTHLVFFPDNVLGVDFNFHGPRASRLPKYLAEKIVSPPGNVLPTHLSQLVRGDAVARLANLDSVHLFDLKIKASASAQIKEMEKSLGDLLEGAGKFGDADVIQLRLKATQRKRHPLSFNLLDVAKRIVGIAQQDALAFELRGIASQTGVVETVDMLKDALTETVDIALESASCRALDSADAYAKIESAYVRHKSDIAAAAEVAVVGVAP